MSTKDRLSDPDGNESFASRWSRKKREDAAGTELPSADESDLPDIPAIPLNTVLPAATTGRMSTGVEADRLKAESAGDSEEEGILTDEDMPDLETLQEGSDFTGFMSPGVSDKLRKLALRKLFAGAGFNIRDGLDDYDEDFTNFEPLGDIVTCDMKHRAELEEEKRQKALAEAEAAEKAAAEDALAGDESSKEQIDEEHQAALDENSENAGEEKLTQETQSDSDQTEESLNTDQDKVTLAEQGSPQEPSSHS